jgi:SWI/SNF-related matrix-associated actin-dependent regulator 1 of chromatin subfamily A
MTITVTQEGGRYVARFPWSVETKDLVKAAGFRFDGREKVWWTKDAAIAAKLSGDTTEIVARMNAEAEAQRARDAVAIEASRAVATEITIPAPDGLEYLPYQKAGIAYAMARQNTLIGDEMGLGKTIQALGLIATDPSIQNVLVICPASLKLNWRNETRKWLIRPMDVTVINGRWPERVSGVVIANYEQIQKHRTQIDAVSWDLLIVDEAHFLKNTKAQRTAAVLGKWDRDETKRIAPIAARRRVFLTGTPIVNRPIELWSLVRALDPKGLGANFKRFTERYCNAHHNGWGMDYSGARNLPELQAKARAAFMVRRLKADVLTELPPKRRQVIVLPAPQGEAATAISEEMAAVARHEETMIRLRAAVELSKASEDPRDYADAVSRLSEAARAAFTELSKLRHKTALAKLPMVVEHVREALDSDEKLVVMCWHIDVVEALAREFPGCAVVTGETAVDARQGEVDRFQTDPACRLFIGTIRAAGVGITLTASSHVVFAELDWVPGNLSQSEDRCHRIGQRNNVLVQHLVLDGSLDARMAHVVVAKQDVLDRALDREAVLPDAQKLAVPTERTEEPEARGYAAPIEEPATAGVSRRQIDEIAPTLSPETVRAIHTGLQMLAGMCDGAVSLDGHGFNRMDARIGHSLAELPSLTLRQAALGRRLVRKYRRQLPSVLLDVAFAEAKAA